MNVYEQIEVLETPVDLGVEAYGELLEKYIARVDADVEQESTIDYTLYEEDGTINIDFCSDPECLCNREEDWEMHGLA